MSRTHTHTHTKTRTDVACPVMSRPVRVETQGNQLGGGQHFSDLRIQPCIGSRCAWWSWADNSHTDGGCGLVLRQLYTTFHDPAQQHPDTL